jgi:hypothetical protein
MLRRSDRALPPLPIRTLGTPPELRRPASGGASQLGRIRGLAVPPEIRRLDPSRTRPAPVAADVAARIRLACRKAQLRLLNSHLKIHSIAAELRARLASRR